MGIIISEKNENLIWAKEISINLIEKFLFTGLHDHGMIKEDQTS